MDRRSRRSVLEVTATGLAAGLAGCASLDDATGDSTDTTGDSIDEPTEPDSNRSNTATGFSTDVFERAETTAKAARDAVVIVRGSNGSTGTGWVLDAAQGYIVTNSHVVIDGRSFTIETFDGETAGATRVGYHQDMIPDVALVQTDSNGLSGLSTGDESALSDGDPLVTIGHPGRYGDWIMSIGRYEDHPAASEWLLSTVPTSQGNSGGPLLTLEGDVVGVVSGTTTGPDDGKDYSKSDDLYAEFPELEELTTSTPISTLLESVETWT
ncbi:S1C family serine protease [Halopiger xanaduensis]|uniref:Peptidase S1 and S6 chymotrypsin/Hap n=1 Tax=Halopiger xanaduensis (strain DSM 18323 / JCM 14033 / SH-6) TaxID=797210 RepID=F8D5A8_HALXS|nr:S1C family serine protease [Halopiger xanaduensis]AEH37607.1 hypothetical protein Halxa_2991 [Halopiger xanaduensis SH-6]